MLLSFLSLLPFALAKPTGQSLRSRNGSEYREGAKVAYFLDDDPHGSSIVSLKIDRDGLLSDPTRTSTHGFGIIGTNTTGFPNTVDPLFSQGSVEVSGDLLFTVNSGSNTVVMFRIHGEDPMHPRMVGKPMDTMADVPVSVSYSDSLKTACVLNGGVRSGVSCFNVDPIRGLSANGPLRTLGRAIDETTPPTGPSGSATQVVFNPDSSAVFAVTKGNAGTTPPTRGYIIGWPVQHGRISTASVASQIADIPMDFGVTFVSESRLFMADPSYGVSILAIAADLKVTEVMHTVVAKQRAICWTAYDPTAPAAYGIDAAVPTAYKFNPATGAFEGSVSAANDTGGLFDSAISRSKLYALASSNGVVVLDLEQEKQLQFLNLSGFGKRAGYTGMVLWPSQ